MSGNGAEGETQSRPKSVTDSPARVLVVDDVAKNIQVVGNVLRKEGYHIAFAMNGRQALDQLKGSDFDLILLDIMMPELDGYETCLEIRKDPRTADIPIIFLTAKADKESVVKGLELGGQDYLTKPFNHAELLARVRTHVELKKSRDRLEEMNRELELANKIRSEFVGIVSHDFGNPLGVISGNVELIHMGLFGELPPKMKEKLETILETTQRLNRLRLDTLDLSKMQTGHLELVKKKGDLVLLVKKVVMELRMKLEEKGVELTVTLPEQLVIDHDYTRLFQVVENYLSNAIRYTPEAGSIKLTLKEQGDELLLCVQDNGRGIDPSELENVFLAFYRTGKRVKGSTGLGLSIVRGIAEAHGGRVWAESLGEGKGSSFFLALPLN